MGSLLLVTNKVVKIRLKRKTKDEEICMGVQRRQATRDFVNLRQAKFCFRICNQKRLQGDYRNPRWIFNLCFMPCLVLYQAHRVDIDGT
jgi:hypothetical protein